MRDEPPREEEPNEPDGEGGSLRTTRPGLVTGLFLTGLIAGRLVHPLSVYLDGTAPRVGWLTVFVLFFAAAVLGAVAWATWRTVHHGHGRLRAHEAVNRLVLAKACAIAGSLLCGGYLGYAISWVGDEGRLAGERLTHSLLAGVASALMVAGSLLLERACRVGKVK